MATVNNAYPEKPVVAPQLMQIDFNLIVSHVKTSPYSDAVKQATIAILGSESGWGKNGGLNNNFAGIQADGSRWSSKFDEYIVATTIKSEGRTGKQRRFCCFNSWKISVNMLLDRVYSRGLYIGGVTNYITNFFVNDVTAFANAYLKEWVTGQKNYKPTTKEISDTASIYKRAGNLLSVNVTASTATNADEKKK